MIGDIVYKKLKKLKDLPGDWVHEREEEGYEFWKNPKNAQHINSTMAEKFGNHRKYKFMQIRSEMYTGNYTHRCDDDNYHYHSSWFMDDEPEVKLENELFEI